MHAWATDESDRIALKKWIFGQRVCIMVYGKLTSTVTSVVHLEVNDRLNQGTCSPPYHWMLFCTIIMNIGGNKWRHMV